MIKDVQAEADWREGSPSLEGKESCSELAVTLEEPQIEWLDWRKLKRAEFPLHGVEDQIWVWDTTGYEPSLTRWNSVGDEKAGLGLILGLPLTEGDFREGLDKLRQLGSYRIALAGFQTPLEERVRQRCESLVREELVRIFRVLSEKSKENNPFRFRGDPEISRKERIAFKIFEELGLIRCLGGTDEIVLEWVPTQRKLDLESSLRFRNGKERFERAWKFQHELLTLAVE